MVMTHTHTHTQRLKFEGQSVQKTAWKQTDGQTDRRKKDVIDYFTFPANAVVKNYVAGIYR